MDELIAEVNNLNKIWPLTLMSGAFFVGVRTFVHLNCYNKCNSEMPKYYLRAGIDDSTVSDVIYCFYN